MRQAHENNGAKRDAWPVEPNRSDEPIIANWNSE